MRGIEFLEMAIKLGTAVLATCLSAVFLVIAGEGIAIWRSSRRRQNPEDIRDAWELGLEIDPSRTIRHDHPINLQREADYVGDGGIRGDAEERETGL